MLKATKLKFAKTEARPKNDLTVEKKFRTMFGQRNVTVEQKGLAHYVAFVAQFLHSGANVREIVGGTRLVHVRVLPIPMVKI